MQRIGKGQHSAAHCARRHGGALPRSRSDLDREVAIKVMSEEIMRDEQARARFYREAKPPHDSSIATSLRCSTSRMMARSPTSSWSSCAGRTSPATSARPSTDAAR